MPRQQRHPPLPRPRRWRDRLARWLRGVAETLDPAPFGLDLTSAPEVWADHVRAAARRAGRTARPPLRWRRSPMAAQPGTTGDGSGATGDGSWWSQSTGPSLLRRAQGEPGPRPVDRRSPARGFAAPTEPPPDEKGPRLAPGLASGQAEGPRRPSWSRRGPLVRPRTPQTDARDPAPERWPRPRPDRPLVRPRRDPASPTAAPLRPPSAKPWTTDSPSDVATPAAPVVPPAAVPRLPAGRRERDRPPTEHLSPLADRFPDAVRSESGGGPNGGSPGATRNRPRWPLPSPTTGRWRITPTPPYLPTAAVLPDGLWPDLPAPRPAAAAAVPVALTLLRQQRLDAEQGAT